MTKAAKFQNFVAELINAKTDEEATRILYRVDGVDQAYQREEITWQQLELLFDLAGRLHWEAEEPTEEEKPEQPEEQPTADQETTFEIYDEEIAQAETLEKIAELEAVINSNYVLGLLTATQREALEGACVYMEQQLKAGRKPDEIKHRNGGNKDAV